ncbi:MAG TPA: hypothetical protein VL966_12290 [Alphaproteobacteria bacterium]|jgi:hypothetical protein|nr:hypothetical protein [Alphaproteobacteria bacterium]
MAPTFGSVGKSDDHRSWLLKGRRSDLVRLLTVVTLAVALSWVFRLG